jgi:hypothetical protein
MMSFTVRVETFDSGAARALFFLAALTASAQAATSSRYPSGNWLANCSPSSLARPSVWPCCSSKYPAR